MGNAAGSVGRNLSAQVASDKKKKREQEVEEHGDRSSVAVQINPASHRHHHHERRRAGGVAISILRIRWRWRGMILLLLLLFAMAMAAASVYKNWETIGYALRPAWDTAPPPFQIIPHYYAANLSMEKRCALHGWRRRAEPRRVFDAVVFNNELDILEIRLRELMPAITKFLILESNSTFTGHAKPLAFAENAAHRFGFAAGLIHHAAVSGRPLRRRESPFVLERKQRAAMGRHLQQIGIRDGDLLISSDVDEIPSFHTIDLLRWCDGIPDVLHLQMSSYLYSFEFFVDQGTWRPSVHVYRPGITAYRHGRQTDLMLADSGWHCSFCFRHIHDIAFKMSAYSHADRLKSPAFLRHDRIQQIICSGADLFDMLPEAYTFKELLSRVGPVPRSYSAVNLPSCVLNHSDRFKFLLPGNCIREEPTLPNHHP